MPKCASTSMQKLLKDYSNLISKDFYIPKSCQLSSDLVNHGNIFFEMSGDMRFNHHKGTFKDLINEIKNIKKNIILSSEAFSYLLTNDKHKLYFEQSLKKLNFKVEYLCFFRNEIGYFFSVLKELKIHRYKQPPPKNKFNYFHDIIHFKNALLHGWVYDDLNERDQKYKLFFNIKKFKKKIEKNSLFDFKYYKHNDQSVVNFGKLFGIKDIQSQNYKLNVVHKKNLKNYLYSVPGFIIYVIYKKTIKNDIPKYLLEKND